MKKPERRDCHDGSGEELASHAMANPWDAMLNDDAATLQQEIRGWQSVAGARRQRNHEFVNQTRREEGNDDAENRVGAAGDGPKDIFECELIKGAVPASSPQFAE